MSQLTGYSFHILSKTVFSPEEAADAFRQLPEEVQEELLRQYLSLGLGVYIYYFLRNALPEKWQKQLSDRFLAHSAWELRYGAGLDFINRSLRPAGITPAAIKGAYLAYHVYPSPALRAKGDYDLWVGEECANAALSVLQDAGFAPQKGISPDHHLPMLVHIRRHLSVELHLQVFHFYPEQPPPDMLKEFLLEDGSFEPELHWLIALEHCRTNHYAGIARTLLDMGYLQKKFDLSAERIDFIRRKLSLPTDPALIFEAFPDFFPENRRLFHGEFPEWVLNDLRSLIGYTPYRIAEQANRYHLLNTGSKLRFLVNRAKLITPAFLREKYGLKKECGSGKLLRYFLFDVQEKTRRLCRLSKHVDEKVLNSVEAGEKIDRFLNARPK